MEQILEKYKQMITEEQEFLNNYISEFSLINLDLNEDILNQININIIKKIEEYIPKLNLDENILPSINQSLEFYKYNLENNIDLTLLIFHDPKITKLIKNIKFLYEQIIDLKNRLINKSKEKINQYNEIINFIEEIIFAEKSDVESLTAKLKKLDLEKEEQIEILKFIIIRNLINYQNLFENKIISGIEEFEVFQDFNSKTLIEPEEKLTENNDANYINELPHGINVDVKNEELREEEKPITLESLRENLYEFKYEINKFLHKCGTSNIQSNNTRKQVENWIVNNKPTLDYIANNVVKDLFDEYEALIELSKTSNDEETVKAFVSELYNKYKKIYDEYVELEFEYYELYYTLDVAIEDVEEIEELGKSVVFHKGVIDEVTKMVENNAIPTFLIKKFKSAFIFLSRNIAEDIKIFETKKMDGGDFVHRCRVSNRTDVAGAPRIYYERINGILVIYSIDLKTERRDSKAERKAGEAKRVQYLRELKNPTNEEKLFTHSFDEIIEILDSRINATKKNNSNSNVRS